LLARIGKFFQKQFSYDASAKSLAFIRIIFFLGLLLLPPVPLPLLWRVWRPEIAWSPIGFWRLFPNQPLWPDWIWQCFISVYLVLILFSALGIFYRFSARTSMLMALLIYTYLFSVQLGAFLFAPIFWAHLILAFSPADGAWSIQKVTFSSSRAGFSIRLLQLNFIGLFFCSALAKIRLSGWSWVSAGTVGDYLLLAAIHGRGSLFEQDWRLRGNLTFAAAPVSQYLSLTVILMEFFAPLLFFSRSIRPYLLFLFVLFQLATWAFLLVDIRPFIPLYACWLVRLSHTPTNIRKKD
jgi:hypothetical protein